MTGDNLMLQKTVDFHLTIQ